ncbi:copper chaperone [Fulvivirga sp. 29W222]|uniref:Copper chaperone n=1 Tax=Fulvivirga marina TaxID=2494733 RepID=A0A937G2H0_9BACT|nr:copper chaperone [Fulvivirga marina]MBL6449016.1 copper chaperone [Fulvivirga marina]
MNTIKFKTNIKCMGCLETVKPQLDQLPEVKTWEVDLGSQDKILTVEATDASGLQKVVDALKAVGYIGEPQN